MHWIFQNPLGQMYGPYFLILYASTMAILIAAVAFHRRHVIRSDQRKWLELPSTIDPYRIAFLRGGISEVLRLATLDLMERGCLKSVPKKLLGSVKYRYEPNSEESSIMADPVLREVANYYQTDRKPTDIFTAGLQNRLLAKTEEWQKWIETEGLQHPREDQARHAWFGSLAILTFVGLGSYKIAAAFTSQHFNIVFLVAMMIAGVVILVVTTKLPRFSLRGKQFIDDVQLAYATIKKAPPGYKPESQDTGTDWAPVMAMGIFGIAALQGSPYDDLASQYRLAQANGSSCGSSGCGSGSSCGGGSGCGGGGCGGCGGGCGS